MRGSAVRYPDQYAWLVLVGMLDVMLTSFLLTHLGGVEVNPIAQWCIEHLDRWGLIALKVVTIAVFVVICEAVGARRHETGRRLAEWAIALSAAPVAIALLLALISNGP
ncbi:MAG: DUF5658 family protein [Planctomycetota bacterium]